VVSPHSVGSTARRTASVTGERSTPVLVSAAAIRAAQSAGSPVADAAAGVLVALALGEGAALLAVAGAAAAEGEDEARGEHDGRSGALHSCSWRRQPRRWSAGGE
jgi:hypothetical protein